MEPITAILTAAGPLVALIGRAIAEGDYAKARELRQQAVDEYGEENLPIIDSIVAQEVGPSAFEGIKEDPAMRGTQADTVAELRNVAATVRSVNEATTANIRAVLELYGKDVTEIRSAQERMTDDLHDVAKAVYEEQSFENKMLKGYIKNWPDEEAA